VSQESTTAPSGYSLVSSKTGEWYAANITSIPSWVPWNYGSPRRFGALIQNGKLYVIGGWQPTGDLSTGRPWGVSPFIRIYVLNSGNWSYGPNLPQNYSRQQVAFINGKIYIIGGNSDNL
jgi:hypothetical protein